MRKSFNQLTELSNLMGIVRDNYDPITCDDKEIASLITKEYYNLMPLCANLMIADNAPVFGHIVYKIAHSNFIIDPLGDSIRYTGDIDMLKAIMRPWIYCKPRWSDVYVSQNHNPLLIHVTDLYLYDNHFNEWDVVTSPCKGLRSITLHEKPIY